MKTKTFIISALIGAASLLSISNAMAQTAELAIEVKGIKELKGNILVAVKASNNPENVVYEMFPVAIEGQTTGLLKQVPVGKVSVSAFQDLNGNYQLDKDEQHIPIEPCYNKDNVQINETDNKLVLKLMDVKAMMGMKPE